MQNFINRAFVLFGIDLNQSIIVWLLRYLLYFI